MSNPSETQSARPKALKTFTRQAQEIALKMLPALETANEKLTKILNATDEPAKVASLTARLFDNFEVIAQRGFGKTPERLTIEDESGTPIDPIQVAGKLAGMLNAIERRGEASPEGPQDG